MKYLTHIAAALLCLVFTGLGLAFLLGLLPEPPPAPADTPVGAFMAAFGPTGYLTFVKVLEVIGGILIVIPRTRNLGLLVLGPILVNILAFHVFITKGAGLLDPMLIVIVILMGFLLWTRRAAFLALLR
jgi:hypothetical protein